MDPMQRMREAWRESVLSGEVAAKEAAPYLQMTDPERSAEQDRSEQAREVEDDAVEL
ncbi:hypothetical protein [Actinomadura sp. WAC 06369]|uniref:hypothetical protein n=1 Tax=Actinomadura sp. WAC 06369 TaxID=2203193 RepID=UPI0013155547|nr:hypothetical protein [Actinomadura sp. WAC 06369]